jgi:hypothetical protein
MYTTVMKGTDTKIRLQRRRRVGSAWAKTITVLEACWGTYETTGIFGGIMPSFDTICCRLLVFGNLFRASKQKF